MKLKWDEDVRFYRTWSLVLIVLTITFSCQLNLFLEKLWNILKSNVVFVHDSFEPLLATFSFFVWINMYRIIDVKGIWDQYRMKPSSLCLTSWETQRLSDGIKPIWLQSILKPLIFILPETWHGFAAVAYLTPILLFDFFYPRRKLPSEPPTFHGLVGSVAASIFFYDFIFYWVHYFMHCNKKLMSLHKVHHSATTLCAVEVVHHSFIDGSLQVATNILVLNILCLHPLARALHNVSITYFLTELHSGYDCPWMLHNVMPTGMLGGPPRHQAHHDHGANFFHQFFTYFDCWFGHSSTTSMPICAARRYNIQEY